MTTDEATMTGADERVATSVQGGLNLDATLRMLAPQPVVDYESGGDDPQPRALAIYLQGLNETPPGPCGESRRRRGGWDQLPGTHGQDFSS